MPTNGLVVMTPTSIAYSGTSAAPNADGSVSFSAVTSLSLNGVFTADYDNYMITMRHTLSASAASIPIRYRASGVDNSTTNSYVEQELDVNGTGVAGARYTDNFAYFATAFNTQRCGITGYFYGPYLAQPTAFRGIQITDSNSARIVDYAGTHNQSVSYDGITFFPLSSSITGLVTVFGFNQ